MTAPTRTLKEALGTLPPFEPPADGWSRLQRALPAASSRRYRRAAAGLALAASVLLCVGVVLRLPSTPTLPAAAEDPELVDLMQRSRTLERDLARLRPQVTVWNAGYAAATQTLESRLAVVDMQLNYAQPASARRLWQDRVALLGSLVETHQAANLQFMPPANVSQDRVSPHPQTEWSL